MKRKLKYFLTAFETPDEIRACCSPELASPWMAVVML